jgi:hypothetical protein
MAWLRAIESASVVERAISVCNLEFHWIGHPPRVTTYPVQDLMHTGSWLLSLFQGLSFLGCLKSPLNERFGNLGKLPVKL